MADQIGVAVENINLFEEVKNKTVELEIIQRRIARGAGASDRDGRGARHHQPLAHGRAAGARCHRRERRAGLWDR